LTFLHPEFLYYMLPPMFILFGLLLTQKETQAHFFSQDVMDKLRVSSNTLTLKARNALFLLMSFFMILALSEPVIKDGKVQIKAKSADIMIALDISDSMLATDMYPNRLELAKQKAITLLDSAPNERIGVVAFAKNSYLVSPLSFDTSAVSFLLRQLDTSSITEKGTDILSVLNVVNESQKAKEKKYLLILSDGGDKTDFTKEIAMAKENGIVVFVLGVATRKGAPIKLKNGEFIKHKGSIIVSKLNEQIAELATATGGVYIEGTNSSTDIKAMFKEIINKSDEKELKSEEIQKYIPLFYYPIGMALFLLLIATSSIGKRQKSEVSAMLILFSLVFITQDSKAGLLDFMDLKNAKEAYSKGEYEKSAKLYQNYAQQSSKGEAHFNAGNSLYKQKKYKKALESYKKATFDTPELRAKNFANMGNSYVKQGEQKNLQEAVKSYEESLNILEDKQTRENLEMVKKLLEKQKQDKKKDQKKDSDKKEQKKDGKKKQDSKDGKKKESDENKKKSSDKKENDSSKSKKSKDKEKSSDDMKSKNEKDKEKKSKDSQGEKEKKKEDLKKLSKDEKDKTKEKSKSGSAQKLSKDKMSEAEEKKWLKQLNMNKNTYMYKLNKEQKPYQGEDEKPW